MWACPAPGPARRPAPHARTTGRRPLESGRYRPGRRRLGREDGSARGLRAHSAPPPAIGPGPAAGVAPAPPSEESRREKGCYLEPLQRTLSVRENEVKPPASQAPATATLPDPTELPARVYNVTSASSALGFSEPSAPERRPWAVWALRHFLRFLGESVGGWEGRGGTRRDFRGVASWPEHFLITRCWR